MAKRSPAKQPSFDYGALQLARNSGLFRPGTEFIIAALPGVQARQPTPTTYRGDLRNGKPMHRGGGQSGATPPVVVPPVTSTLIVTAKYVQFAPNNPSGWPAANASVSGGVGTPVYSLADNDGGNFQIDSSTGVISKAVGTVLANGNHSVTVMATGVTPLPTNQAVTIPVANSMDFSQPGNSAFI